MIEIIGWLGGILLSICGIPETIRTIKDRKCHVGYGMLITWGLGEILLFIYVLPKMDYPLLLNYFMNIIFIGIMLYYKIKKG